MARAPRDLADHLERAFGRPVRLRPAKPDGLPVYLRETYDLLAGDLLGRGVWFAVARPAAADASPSRLAADYRALSQAAGDRVVALVLCGMTSARRGRLVAAGIPFMVPGRQLFLPQLLVDLREYYPRTVADAGPDEALGWAAQTVLLRHLLWRDVENTPLADVATACGYSAMTLTHVRRELESAGIVETQRVGRSKRIHVLRSPRDTWDVALPRLRSPVRKTIFAAARTSEARGLTAGITALARATNIAADPVATIALGRKEARRALDARALVTCDFADEAEVFVEIWMTPPEALSRGEVVDPLSLYLSLRDTHDARVEQAIAELLESVPW